MKNLTILTNAIIVIISLLTINFISAQNINNPQNQEKESNGYLVYFEPNVSDATIDSIMNEYNSHEEWITTHSKVRYWKVNSFPFSVNDSTNILDMDGLWLLIWTLLVLISGIIQRLMISQNRIILLLHLILTAA